MTCRDNILLPARIGGRDTTPVEKDIEELANYLGVTHCLSKFPFEISGGEQQRINIIRALSLRPKILLCDEPTGNLDSKNSEKVASLLKSLAAEFGATLLVVTHDDKVASFFPRKIVIEDGQIIG
jgi:ABC-type lipoprotein export system ATPase subunit